MLKCKHLKELQADAHMVQNINNRTTRHPPIEVQYSNKDLKKNILHILHRLLFILKNPAIPFSPNGPHNAIWCSFPHNPITMTSKHPSTNQ